MKTLLIIAFTFAVMAAACNGQKAEQPQTTQQASAQTSDSSSKCDPNYSPCVPIATDVDCAGGGGNGPAYVRGPVRVIGRDIYGLDRDGDGIGCER